MKYNFDEIINRRDTYSLKHDFVAKRGMPDDILPLWVADMDFKSPLCVTEAIAARVRHGVFGYSEADGDYFEILRSWFSRYFCWDTQSDWLVITSGVVYSICAAIRSLTNKGDAILIQPPVYYPFAESILMNERKITLNELVYRNGEYTIDFEDFEAKIIENNVKLFILCSPHDPVGRVWTKDELVRLGDICVKHGVIVIGDEIHEDFIYPGHTHSVFASLKPEFAEITVACTAPTKTFNLAGLHISNIFIANSDIRRKFKREVMKTGYSQHNIMGIIACKAAYSDGREWLDELNMYLTENLRFVKNFLQEKLPQIRLVEPQGTYLVWLDCKAMGLDDKQLDDLIVHKAKLWLDGGTMFGAGGKGFQRINIGSPRTVIEQALVKLEQAIINI